MTVQTWQSARNLVTVLVLICTLGWIGGCSQQNVQYQGMSVPPTEFLIGPEDVLLVTVWRNQEL